MHCFGLEVEPSLMRLLCSNAMLNGEFNDGSFVLWKLADSSVELSRVPNNDTQRNSWDAVLLRAVRGFEIGFFVSAGVSFVV